MFRIGVISDTHGSLHGLQKALDTAGRLDMIMHAGDFYRDAIRIGEITGLPVRAVAGNCDPLEAGLLETEIVIKGKRLFLTHGHLYGVKFSFQKLLNESLKRKFDAVVFGHTHLPLNKWEQNILFFNPGSLTCPNPGCKPSFGVLEIENDVLRACLHFIEK